MSKNFKNLVKMAEEMVICENKDIEKKYGIGYNSNHEFFAVLREEVEEAEENINDIHFEVETGLWDKVRNNKDITDKELKQLKKKAINCMAELSQVSAVIDRYRHGINKGVKKKKKKA